MPAPAATPHPTGPAPRTRLRRRAWTAFLPALLLAWFGLTVDCAATGPGWEVKSVLFRAGDDLEWSTPLLDEADWLPLDPGRLGQVVPFPAEDGRGWYRIRFRTDDPVGEPRGISAGFIGTVSELYLDGRKFGGGGGYEPVRLPPQRTLHGGVVSAERIAGGIDHVLAIRVRRQLGRGGLLGGPVGVMAVPEFLRVKRDAELVREVVRIASVTVCVAWAALLLLLRRLDPLATELRGAVTPTLLLAVTQALYSQFAEVLGLTLGGIVLLLIAVQVTMPLALYQFIRRLRPLPARGWDWLVWLSPLGLVLVTAAYARDLTGVTAVYTAYFGIGWLAGCHACLQAWRAGVPLARGYLTAWVCLGLTSFGDYSLVISEWLPIAAMWFSPTDVGLLLFVFVFGSLVVWRYVRSRGAEAKLRLQVLQAHAEERRRIGRDLHDGVAQDLQALQFSVELARGGEPASELRTTLDSLSAQLRSSLAEVRRLAADLAPPSMAKSGLNESLARIADELADRHQVRIEVRAGPLPDLPPAVAENLCRLVQESLRNACRHSGAAQVELTAAADRHQLTVCVRDAGRGFDPQQVSSGRMGLRGIAERVAILDGKLELASAAGRGTIVRVSVPLPQP